MDRKIEFLKISVLRNYFCAGLAILYLKWTHTKTQKEHFFYRCMQFVVYSNLFPLKFPFTCLVFQVSGTTFIVGPHMTASTFDTHQIGEHSAAAYLLKFGCHAHLSCFRQTPQHKLSAKCLDKMLAFLCQMYIRNAVFFT